MAVSATSAALIFAATAVSVGVPPPAMPAKLTCSAVFPSRLTFNVWIAEPVAVELVTRTEPPPATPVSERLPSRLALAALA